jgi:ADP-ribose pyrophosphatase YjhB (NUDIX family)
MSWAPHVTVATIVERDGRFLLVYEEAEGKKVYNQPAGHLEANETLIEAAIRETLEETGWDVKPESVVSVRLYEAPTNGITYLRVTFAATAIAQHLDRALDTGIIEAVWLSREEIVERLPELRSPMTLEVIDEYLSGKRFDLSLLGN